MAQIDGSTPSNQTLLGVPGVRYCIVDVSDNSTTVLNGPGYLVGVWVDVALSAHALPIKDGSQAVVNIPASASAGSKYEFNGMYFGTSIVVDPNDVATGTVVVAFVAHPYA